jgi:hypothetical protein
MSDDEKTRKGGREWLFLMAAFFALLAAGAVFRTLAARAVVGTLGSVAVALVIGLVTGILYVLVAAFAIGICQVLRKWAYPNEAHPWTADTKAMLGAFWPVSLLFWSLICPFFCVINRLFRD